MTLLPTNLEPVIVRHWLTGRHTLHSHVTIGPDYVVEWFVDHGSAC